MPTNVGGTTAPNPDPIVLFLEYLRGLDLTLYVHPEKEEPYMVVPGDTVLKNYPIAGKRVRGWVWAQWVRLNGKPPADAAVKAGVAELENRAYEQGVSLPTDEQVERFNDDPVIAAVHSWVPLGKDKWVRELATKAFQYLRYYGENHPNAKDWPKDTSALGRRLKALDKIGMLAALKVKFESAHTEAGTVYKFTRLEDADRLTAVRIVPSGGKTMAVKDLAADSIDLFEELEKLPPLTAQTPLPPPPTGETTPPPPPPAVSGPKDKPAGQPVAKERQGIEVEHVDPLPVSEQKAEEVKKARR